jgi:hypothetical protein
VFDAATTYTRKFGLGEYDGDEVNKRGTVTYVK